MLWLLLPLLALGLWVLSRRWADRAARRAVRRFRARVDRFKLTGKRYIRTALLGDEDIAAAVRAHAKEHSVSEAAAWKRVGAYIDEIVPFFNILMYYEVGYALSRAVLSLFWKVTVEQEDAAAIRALPRESIVIYLFNHRSNADYVLAGYALAGHVSISYAVGEWARVFPLEYLFKSFGSYFIRRRYREPLYHTVLERYVQLITRNGVTQGIFPEGGLSRDGDCAPRRLVCSTTCSAWRASPGSPSGCTSFPSDSRTIVCSKIAPCCAKARALMGSRCRGACRRSSACCITWDGTRCAS